jgi:hypothetical protein
VLEPWQTQLTTHHDYLVDVLSADVLAARLLSSGVLSWREKRKIIGEGRDTDRAKNKRLLRLLMQKGLSTSL